MENKLINIKIVPVLLFLIGLAVVLYLFFSNSSNSNLNIGSRASSARNLTLEGEIEKLPECIDSFICYDIVEKQTNSHYHLYSKRFPKLFKKDVCLGKENCAEKSYSNIGLEDYAGLRVKLSGLLVEGKVSYIIITDINTLTE